MMYAVATLVSTISDKTAFAMTLERRKNSVSSKRTVLTVPPSTRISLRSDSEKAASDDVYVAANATATSKVAKTNLNAAFRTGLDVLDVSRGGGGGGASLVFSR